MTKIGINHTILAILLFNGTLLLCTEKSIAAPTHNFQALNEIQQTAEEFATTILGVESKDTQVTARRLDSRLRLIKCNIPLEAYLPDFTKPGQNMTVGVRCNGKNTWSLYVPLRVHFSGYVVVINQPLARGTVITEQHLNIEHRNLSNLNQDYFTDISAVVGQMAKRPLQGGKIVSRLMLDQPKLIRRGETVTMVTSVDSIKVSMNGKALMDGRVGQRIRVKNNRSQQIVEGIVQANRMIQLD